jgi:hypothetical protein
MSILNACDTNGLINRPQGGTPRPGSGAQAGLINTTPRGKETATAPTRGTGLINDSPQTEE